MGRKNRNVGRSNSAGRRLAKKGDRAPLGRRSTAPEAPRIPLEDLVMPDGKCMLNHRKPKARFATKEKAQKALDQAQRQRAHRGSGHVEKRVYRCDGCEGWHLTSLEKFEPRRTA